MAVKTEKKIKINRKIRKKINPEALHLFKKKIEKMEIEKKIKNKIEVFLQVLYYLRQIRHHHNHNFLHHTLIRQHNHHLQCLREVIKKRKKIKKIRIKKKIKKEGQMVRQ